MTREERQQVYAALSAPFPEDAIERTDGKLTGKGYSTTGIKYQFVVNRLNEVLGLGGFRTQRSLNVREIARNSGRAAFEGICEITLELGEWVDGKFIPFGQAVADGGHIASTESDARKGSFTNAFKKGAAFFGVGKQAYEGTIDDDHLPSDEAVRRLGPRPAPATRSQVQQQQHAGNPAPAQPRERLTSAQLGAIKTIVRKRGIDQGMFRSDIQRNYGVTPEFLTRRQASDVISRLDREGKHNGSGNGVGRPGEAA